MDKTKTLDLVHEVDKLEQDLAAKIDAHQSAKEATSNAFIAEDLARKALAEAREQLARAAGFKGGA